MITIFFVKIRSHYGNYQKIIADTRERMEFIVVYVQPAKNPLPNQVKKEKVQDSESRDRIGKYFLQKAKQELILFDLEHYKKLYVRDVHTYSIEEFEERFL